MVEYSYQLDTIFKSLADPTRRDILRRVCQQQQTISEIAEHYQMTFAGVAKHLTVLEKAELITKTKQGKEQIITAKADTFNLASEALEKYRQILLKRYNRLEKLLESGS